ncbi:hypothetical protein O1611_g25 [Lasiodiplodia mahajangana]|uniref:Uncharacterized protein n=1 Tax=Lasiodiplodia mahajangana TaxID=1108764 RepID=A0ACC2K1H4_9PEZI|nr:hypothetical protein O1611_g25 [Lasiodiplodia mahajangana]
MTNYIASTRLPPLYLIGGSQYDSDLTLIEPTGLNPWQKRWNKEWLNEAYIPYMRHKDLLAEFRPNPDASCDRYQKTQQGTDQFVLDAINAGIASPKGAPARTRWGTRTRFFTWPVRMLSSDIKRLWGRWRKHRGNSKAWQMVVVMEEHGETPRWKGEMRFTFRDGFLDDYLNSPKPGNWINFPSAEDIKWYLVRGPNGMEWLQGGQDARTWAPKLTPESCIPFVLVNGHVVRDCRPHDAHKVADGDVFDNFMRSCPHCGQKP